MKKFYRKGKEKPVPIADSQPVVTRSTSQLDFDSRVDHVEGMVKLLSMEPSYQPNESELQVTALQAYASYLRSLNLSVVNAQVQLSNARAARNALLYKSTGIHGLAKAVKRYVKSAFGYKSVAFRQISGLRFFTSSY